MLPENIFTRKFSIRFPQQLVAPKINDIDFLEFPKFSSFHYTEVDNVVDGPPSDLFYLRNIEKKIPTRHITQLASMIGNPRKLSIPIDPVIRNFHVKNRRYRLVRHGDTIPNDELSLLVVNHALSSRNYKYNRAVFSDYNRWTNINATVFYQLGKTAKETGRHQYVIFNLPRQLPSLSRLDLFSKRQTQDMLKSFSDPNAALILEFWKWIDPEIRHTSTLNFADPAQYDKINIIFEESGKWIMLNLGLIDSWIFSEKREKTPTSSFVALEEFQLIKEVQDFDNILPYNFGFESFEEHIALEELANQKIKIVPGQFQKRFLRCLMTLMETRTVETSTEEDTDISITEIKSTSDKAQDQQADEDFESEAVKKLKTLDEDLKQLEVIEKEHDIQEAIVEAAQLENKNTVTDNTPINIEDFDVHREPHEIIKATVDKLASDGLMSGAEYRKMLNINDKALSLPSPIEGVLMKDYIKVSQEDLKVKETIFPDRVTVLDKSQLKSSLENFDKTYIEKSLKKETIRMALASQKAGFVITDYKVEELEGLLGSQEVHSFKVNPVVGKQTTLYFKVPKIDSSGEYRVGGNSYRMRKQRTDLPIRKIGHDRVQLSSYYGKVFVSRSDKRVNDYGEWLIRSLNEKSLESNDNSLVIKPGDVFNNLAKTPTAFSSISRGIREIDHQGFKFHFDHNECIKIYTKELVDKYASQGYQIFADNDKGNFLLLDINNTIYSTDSKTDPQLLASFEEFFGLDSFKAPVNFAECRVFGQNIPVGLILGYYYGLEKLLRMLKVTPRRVLVGQRMNLQAHEWEMVFADETLIFNKEDVLATLVLAGFRDFAKSLRNFSVYKFDAKGVYLSVLEQKKITARYIRELDLLDDMFIDPITEDLLKIMGEPLTFRGLLIRSSYLLMTDYHPNPLNMDFQVIKGYERVAAAIYSEMVLSVREQRKSLGRSTSQISLNPLAVWKRITADPAVKIVSDINPINNLKEMEAVTFNGTGGRSSRTMNAASRVFDETDKGVMSESTSDSSDVGINTFTVPNPSFNSVRGTTTRKTDDELTASQLLSTSANLSVGADTDD